MKKINAAKGSKSSKAVKSSVKAPVVNSDVPESVRKRAAAESDPAKSSAIITAWRRSQVAAKGSVPEATTHSGQKGAPPPRPAATPAKGDKVTPAAPAKGKKDDAPKAADPKKVAKGKAAVEETKASTKRGNGVPPVNGLKFTVGLECLVVRDRSGLEGVTDARITPTDVVRAKFVGYDSATHAYLFDDGRASRMVDPIFLHAGGKKDASVTAEESIFPVAKPKTARKSSEALNERLSLWYGREDYAKAGLIMMSATSKADIFNAAVAGSSAKDRAVMASVLRQNPFKLFAGTAGDEAAQKMALTKAWKKAHKTNQAELKDAWTQAKAVRGALVERFGETVKITAAEADRLAEEAASAKKAPKGKKSSAA